MNDETRGSGVSSASGPSDPPANQACKVAAVTLSFWVLKVFTTTVGDVSGDALSISLGLGYGLALLVALAVFVPLLIAQLRVRRFMPWLYWLAIFSSSTVGAEISDGLDRALHLGDLAGTLLLLGVLCIALGVWFARRGGVLAVRTRSDERYYWLSVVFANSVGSALGDLVGAVLGVGVLGATAVYAGVVVVLLALHYTTRLNKGALFWSGFVVTRIPF